MAVKMAVPLSRPDISELERAAVQEVLGSSQLSLGPRVPEFERMMAEVVGTKFAVAVNSGTSGLHLCVRALNLGEGDEVITTPLSFVASANCLLYERVRPVFVDIDLDSYNMNVDLIEAAITKRTRAILGVDIFGVPSPWERLEALAAARGLRLIEDSCEALGSTRGGRQAGSFGDCAVFGFYPNKQITTGEGGMITTNDSEVARACRSMRNQGRAEGGGWMVHERLGYNYRLSDINCALGCAQVKRLDELLARRARVAEWYDRYLEGCTEIVRPPRVRDGRMSWFVYIVRLMEGYSSQQRNELIRCLAEEGVQSGPYLPVIHLQPFYRQAFGFREGMCPVAEHVAERTLALPFYSGLREEEVAHVSAVLRTLLANRIRPA